MMTEVNAGLLRVDDLLVDLQRIRVTRGDETLDVSGLTFDALLCLIQAAPSVVSHDELVRAVWNGAALADETITQRISLLRRALGDAAESPRYVATVRGRGYRLIPEVIPARTESRQKRATSGSRTAHRGVRTRVVWGATLLVMSIAVAVGLRSGEARSPLPPELAEAAPTATEMTRRGYAYLSRHRERDNELAVELFRRALATEDTDRGRIGLSLAFSQRATKFNRSVSWAERAEALAREAVATRPDAEAYHALGLALDAQGRVSAALEAYRRAARLDPGHAGALASAAYLLFVTGDLAEALHWDLRALATDADLPYLEVQVAQVLATLGFQAEAERWYARSVELRPDNVFGHAAWARYRLERGDLAAAEALAREAIRRGIHRPEPFVVLGHVAWIQGRAGSALESYRRAAQVNRRQSGADWYAAALVASGGVSPVEIAFSSERQPRCDRPHGAAGEWPDIEVERAMLCAAEGDSETMLAALDSAVALGFRDADWLAIHPGFAPVRSDDGFRARLARLRELVADERGTVLRAAWLPAGFL